MNYQLEIPTVAVVGPALAAFAVVAVRRRRADLPGWRGGPLALRVTTAVYLAAVASLTLLPLWVYGGAYRNQTPWTSRFQLVPLVVADVSMVANLLMFVPFGFLLPLLSRRWTTLGRTVVAAALTSLAIEATQMLLYIAFGNGRSVDINDVLANTTGGLLGYAVLQVARRARATRAVVDRLSPAVGTR